MQTAKISSRTGAKETAGLSLSADKSRKKEASINIFSDLCKGCRLCMEVCPPNVLSVSTYLNVLGYNSVQYDGQGCTGCGVCFYACPEPGAIMVIKAN